MAQRKRQRIVSYHHSIGGGYIEVLACGHFGHVGTPIAILMRIHEGKSRLCAECMLPEKKEQE